jgi:hypothetical protein
MEINNIAKLLEKFKKLKPSDLYVKEAFIESMKEVMNVEISKAEINVNGSNIFLTVHPALKTEIFLRKKEILKSLEQKLNKSLIKNII